MEIALSLSQNIKSINGQMRTVRALQKNANGRHMKVMFAHLQKLPKAIMIPDDYIFVHRLKSYSS